MISEEYTKELIEALKNLPHNAISSAALSIMETLGNNGNVYICGNGGSAATASHFANDLNKYASTGGRLRAFALTDNVPLITAIANDLDYAEIFYEQLRNFLRANDILICISTSGRSKNVINAATYARSIGAGVITITGPRSERNILITRATNAIVTNALLIGQLEDLAGIVAHLIAHEIHEARHDTF